MLLCVGAVRVSAATTQAVKATRPTETIAWVGCVTAECHANIKSSPVLHGPIAVNACDACHEWTDAKAHTFEIKRQKEELCTYCHEFSTRNLPVVHKPVTNGECLGCHDPHGSQSHSLTRENSIAEMCGRCHESITLGHKVLHDPVAKGQCTSCHAPHAAAFPKLLDVVGTDLCLTCHGDFEKRMVASKVQHKALEKGCQQCHDVHGSNVAKELTQAPAELCIGCHDKVKAQAIEAKYKHSVVMENDGRACLTCHTPHSGDVAKLMNDVPSKVCMSCHAEKIKGYDVAAVPEVIDPKLTQHGPIREGQCGGCHGAHGTNQPRLLTKAYSGRRLYQQFSTEQYELCFSCHDPRLAQQREVVQAKVTNFRDGTRNLHFVHANDGNRSRSCSLCHATHAATNDRMLREWVQYKVWPMPINFRRTETGGSCAPGCHDSFGYDREHAIGPTTMPSTRPVQVVARGEQRAPVVIKWTLKDIVGAEVTVPADQRPTVLVFVRGELNPDLTKLLISAAPEGRRAQIVMILGGENGKEQAGSLASSMPWPVVADELDSLGERVGVHAWPAVLVLQGDGTILARLGGATESLALRLEPYLDFATRKIDRSALDQQLAAQRPEAEESAKKAARLGQIASALLEQGKAEQAQKVLDQAIKLQPQSMMLKVAMIRALTLSKRASDALAILEGLPANALAPEEQGLLRGSVLVSMERWDEAKTALLAAVKHKPDLAEGHYLLGRIYEHEQHWQQAAQEYRAGRTEK